MVTLKKLKEDAKTHNIKGRSTMNKAQLCDALKKKGVKYTDCKGKGKAPASPKRRTSPKPQNKPTETKRKKGMRKCHEKKERIERPTFKIGDIVVSKADSESDGKYQFFKFVGEDKRSKGSFKARFVYPREEILDVNSQEGTQTIQLYPNVLSIRDTYLFKRATEKDTLGMTAAEGNKIVYVYDCGDCGDRIYLTEIYNPNKNYIVTVPLIYLIIFKK